MSWFGFLVNELPFIAFYLLAASAALAIGQDDIDSPVGRLAFGLAILASAGLVVIVWRAVQTGPIVDRLCKRASGRRGAPGSTPRSPVADGDALPLPASSSHRSASAVATSSG